MKTTIEYECLISKNKIVKEVKWKEIAHEERARKGGLVYTQVHLHLLHADDNYVNDSEILERQRYDGYTNAHHI